MKRRFGIAGLAVMGLIVVLGALGIGYGLWQQTLTVSGIVSTGTVSAALSEEPVFMSGQPPADADTLNEATCSESMPAPGQLNVNFGNAFPMVCCTAQFNVTNTGTIAIIAELPVLGAYDAGALTASVVSCYSPGALNSGVLAPNASAYCSVRICVNEAAEQNAQYTVPVTVFTHQYNEQP